MDSDFDHHIDHMTLQLTFKPPQGYVLNNFNLFLEFDAKLTVSTYFPSHISAYSI